MKTLFKGKVTQELANDVCAAFQAYRNASDPIGIEVGNNFAAFEEFVKRNWPKQFSDLQIRELYELWP